MPRKPVNTKIGGGRSSWGNVTTGTWSSTSPLGIDLTWKSQAAEYSHNDIHQCQIIYRLSCPSHSLYM